VISLNQYSNLKAAFPKESTPRRSLHQRSYARPKSTPTDGLSGDQTESVRRVTLSALQQHISQERFMIYNNVILRAKDASDIGELKELLTTQAEVSLTEPGCERFEVYHSEAEPAVFLLIEWWATQEDLDTHRATSHFVSVYRPSVMPLVERFPHPSQRLI
jgi:quinol monooxygenase YgiN